MNKFPWNCGECPMLHTYDLSIDDLTHICLWSKIQIDDCDRYKSAECPMEEHDAKIKAEVVDEHFRKIMSFINTNNRGNCDYFIVDQIENYIAEQLKEQKNEN